MGRSLAWFVVESGDAAAIATALDVKLTGRRGPREKFPLALQRLPDGRSLVISTNVDEPLFKSKQLGSISRLGRMFNGSMSETVMFSGFAAWSKGRKTWSIEHHGDDDLLHLKATGKLLREDLALKDAALELQRAAGENAEVDHVFELALDLARRHAALDPNDIGDGEFEELHIGAWRELWRKTFWWRLAFMLLAGFIAFFAAMNLIAKALFWIATKIGLAWVGAPDEAIELLESLVRDYPGGR